MAGRILGYGYRLYAAWLARRLVGGPVPGHVALVVDGNRRWARQHGHASVSVGHRAGADHIEDALRWCAAMGIRHVSVFVASADNLAKRSPEEVGFLMDLAERVVAERLMQPGGRWRVHIAGRLSLLPDSTAHALKRAVDETATGSGRDSDLVLAIGYSGRAEVVDAVRAVLSESALEKKSLEDVARTLTLDDITEHLYLPRVPPPNLVIRTSGEQRLSDFLLWQTTDAELYFCDVYWPGFRQVDFLRALRSYAARKDAQRRAGYEPSAAVTRSRSS